MIKKIIAVSDIHIRNLRRSDEYQEKLQKFLDECKKIVKKYKECMAQKPNYEVVE